MKRTRGSDRFDPEGPSRLGRRRLLAGVAAGGASLALAGCLGDDGQDVDPIALDGERDCDQCGMIIEDHPGPVGQIHFDDDAPEGDRPGQFCSSTCTYTYRFDAMDEGRNPVATYLTDYSTVDYETFEEGDDVLFSSHVDADAFAPLPSLSVVAGSDVVGAMGPELIPFSDGDDVGAFRDAYGGTAMDAEDVDRATVDAL